MTARWDTQLRTLEAEAAAIKAAGRWRAGPRTVLELLRINELEVKLVACLAWLLKPEGHHGLGDRAVRGLLDLLGLPFDTTATVRVVREERRYTAAGKATPADLVVRVGGVCVLIEAKVNAGEHGDQCARLEQLWAHENPTRIFLTRGEMDAPDGWTPLTWQAILGLLVPFASHASPGGRDIIETLQLLYVSKGFPVPDEKSAFYLRNWRLVTEWAALRDGALATAAAAIGEAVERLDPAIRAQVTLSPEPQETNGYLTYELWKPTWQQGEIYAAIALQWHPAKLLTEPHPWPYAGVRISRLSHLRTHPFVKKMVNELDVHAVGIGWSERDVAHGWPWFRYVPPLGDERDLANLSEACRVALETGWHQLSGPLDALFKP